VSVALLAGKCVAQIMSPVSRRNYIAAAVTTARERASASAAAFLLFSLSQLSFSLLLRLP